MGKIKNSTVKNTFGDGYEQIITNDDGSEYTIRNSSWKNTFGDGYEKEIVKTKASNSEGKFEDIIPGILSGKNAGMMVYAVSDPYSASLEKEKRKLADCWIDDYTVFL